MAEPRVRFTSGDPAGVVLAWDQNPETDIAGYYVYLVRAAQPTVIERRIFADTCEVTISGLQLGAEYRVSVSAVNTAQMEGQACPPVTFTAAPPPLERSVLLQAWGDGGALERSLDLRTWESVTEPYVFPRTTPRVFFRVRY